MSTSPPADPPRTRRVPRPLKGVRVISLALNLPGPAALRRLADMGAHCLKINPPAGDPMKAKHLEKALMQFSEEGAAKVFKPMIGSGFIVGVVGPLHFEVLASRIEQEYSLPVRFEPSQFTSARWVTGAKADVEKFVNVNKGHIAVDNDGDMVYLTRLKWDIDRIERDHPELKLTATKEMMV